MANTSLTDQKFEHNIAHLMRARFPFLYISTWEEERVISLIREVANDADLIRTKRNVFEWSLTGGVTRNGKVDKAFDCKDCQQPAFELLKHIEAYKEPAIFILKDFHVFFGANNRQVNLEAIRKIRDLAPVLKLSQNPKNIIFISPTLCIPDDLEKDITVVNFDLPSTEEIDSLLTEMIQANNQSGRIQIKLTNEEKERLIKAALGLTLQEAENAFARTMVQDGVLDVQDVDVILEEKQRTIRKSGILEFVQSDLKIEDVGGLDNLKRWLTKRNNSWLDSASRYNLPAPKGLLITGVPGCGKSLISKATSAMWQLPLLQLDMGKIFSGILGSSEENMRRAIQTAEAISPCILWVDEIEKGFGGVSGPTGDGGTSSRIFGAFLTWMQEKTKAVFVIATANNISALPPEMMRKGRFDEIFFVDLPTFNERRDILRLHLKKRLKDQDVMGNFAVNDEVLDRLSNLTEGFVGAELEYVVINGLFEAFYEKRAITFEDFERAIELTVPLSVTQAEQISALREWANVRAVAATKREDRAEYDNSGTDDKHPRAAFDDEPSNDKQNSKAVPLADDDILSSRGGRPVDF